ncbi:MAG: hypothetical protein V2A58_14165 [Planctomycetota bacterium]
MAGSRVRLRAGLAVLVMLTLAWAGRASAVEIPDDLLCAIARVETRNGADGRDGDRGASIGHFQIQRSYWSEAMEWLGRAWPYKEARDPEKAKDAVRAYLERWGTYYEETSGQMATPEVLARIHNGGPRGWQKRRTLRYWRRVIAALERLGSEEGEG